MNILFLLLLPLCSLCFAEDFRANNKALEIFSKGIIVDLREPKYCNGVLSTEKGGVITASEIRIQAQHIVYTRRLEGENPQITIEAEGNLIVQFGCYVFVGKRLEYDFRTQRGTIYEGRTGIEPWYFGGCIIHLFPNEVYTMENGYLTTSENRQNEWELFAKRACLVENRYLTAKHLEFRIYGFPFFWFTGIKLDLKELTDSPIRYKVGWGGRLGPRFGIIYEMIAWEQWKAWLRLDYRIRRGPGAGIETRYKTADRKGIFQTINYVSRDTPLIGSHPRTRYRFQGTYRDRLANDKINVYGSYDKLSDKEMATDYHDHDIELDTAERTQLILERQEKWWTASSLVRVRINGFQTLKQELPTFTSSLRPFRIGNTGIISDNRWKLAYLNFVYADHIIDHVHGYRSGRLEFSHRVYRPSHRGPFTITPEAGIEAIFYSNSPDKRWLAVGQLGCDANANFHRYYGTVKHIVTPYLRYKYYTFPTIGPHEHYIFDITDGWYRLNALRIGMENSLFFPLSDHYFNRHLFTDVYTYAFFDTKTIPTVVPRVYGNITYLPIPTLRYTLQTAWDLAQKELLHLNVRAEWTISPQTAISCEYRHRSSFDWRKVDYDNFILDSFLSTERLLHSALSDRRDTFLLHAYHKFHPNLALEIESRHGWRRRFEPPYHEFAFSLLGTLQAASHFKITYQHALREDRITFNFAFGLPHPPCAPPPCPPQWLE